MNVGNANVSLILETGNWIPSSAQEFISVSWDYEGTQILPNEIVKIILTITVSPSAVDVRSFNFDIVVIASG